MCFICSCVQDDCVAALRNGTVDAFLQHYILNAYYTTVQPCDLTLVDIGFMVGRTGGQERGVVQVQPAADDVGSSCVETHTASAA
jgi:hypothetical protein